MRLSILPIAFFPPLRAFCSASSRRACISLAWASSNLRSRSRPRAPSWSARSSSARRAASIMAFWAFSSEWVPRWPSHQDQPRGFASQLPASSFLQRWLGWRKSVLREFRWYRRAPAPPCGERDQLAQEECELPQEHSGWHGPCGRQQSDDREQLPWHAVHLQA